MGTSALPVTFGMPERSIEVAGFRVTEAQYGPDLTIDAHEHQFPSWTTVLSGGFEERFRDRRMTCTPGAVLSKPATATHSNRYGPGGARVLIVEVRALEPELHAQVAAVFTDVRLLPARPASGVVRRVRRAMQDGEGSRALRLYAALLELGALFLRTDAAGRGTRRGPWLRRVADRLLAEFVDPPSLDLLAREAGVHPVYLCAAFRNAYGCSPGEFVRRARLERACRLLAQTDAALSEVAFAAGYSDQSHLNRRLRSGCGMTPLEYRRRCRAG